LSKAGAAKIETRQLQKRYDTILSYQPETLVTDCTAIDLDFLAIQGQFESGTKVGIEIGERIYREGAFSHPVAKLTLDNPLSEDVPRGTRVMGVAISSQVGTVEGVTRDFWARGDTEVLVEYAISPDQSNYVQCQVGANPKPNFKGCFIDSGVLTVPEYQLSLPYSYDEETDNMNFRAIEGFSHYAQDLMAECEGNCPYPEFEIFAEYYGMPDYADTIITSAFNGETTFLANGNMDFSLLGDDGRAAFLERAMITMNIWMWVIRQMNFAIDICEGRVDCPEEDEFCEESPGLHAWDRGVAYYIGTLNTSPGSNNGKMLYNLANEECTQFKTCSSTGDSLTGEAFVNSEILDNFRGGQAKIMNRDCEGAKVLKDSIASLMTIPLIQGTLRYAHLLWDAEDYWEPYGGQAAAFAHSILPLVHECDKDAATLIHENLRVQNNPNVDFVAVKRALERNYACLKVTCSQVGGIYNEFSNGQYLENAEPCTEFFGKVTMDVDDDQKVMAVGLGIAIGVLAVLAIMVCIIRRAAERKILLKRQTLDVEGYEEKDPVLVTKSEIL